MIVKINTGVSAYITAKVTNKKGEVKYENTFKNLILDNGMNKIASQSSEIDHLIVRCNVGTGTGAPSEGQTGLTGTVIATQIADGSVVSGNSGGTPDWYHYRRRTYRFNEGAAAGNLTEIGFSSGVNSNYFSRQLFKDEFGSPTTVTVLSDEFLTITYEVRYYPNMTDVTDSVMIDGDSYTYTIRPYLVGGASSFWSYLVCMGSYLGFAFKEGNIVNAVNTTITGASANSDVTTASTYVAGNFYRDFTGSVNPATANFGSGIGSVLYPFLSYPAFQIGFSPKIPKTNTKKFELTLRISWSRV